MAYDADKFKELVLYIAQKSVDDSTYGAVKLNKLLFFSDFLAYANLGESITGATYQKLQHGPCARALLPVQGELIAKNEAVVVPVGVSGNFTQKRLVALRAPDLTLFKPDEIALVDSVIEQLKGATATKVSRFSHRWSLGWKAASIGEDVPYQTVFWQIPEMSSAMMTTRGAAVAAKLGFAVA